MLKMTPNDNITVHTCPNIRIKAKKLGLSIPNTIWILPIGFERLDTLDIVYESGYDTVSKIFSRENIPYSLLQPDEMTYPKRVQHSFELLALPTVVFIMKLIVENPDIISTALNVIDSFLKRRAQTLDSNNVFTVRSTVIKETKPGVFKKYKYNGPLSGYKDFIRMVLKDADVE